MNTRSENTSSDFQAIDVWLIDDKMIKKVPTPTQFRYIVYVDLW